MLRGINVGGRNMIKMDALRDIYQSLGLRNPQTYIQSGNVLFETGKANLAIEAKRVEDEIERLYQFRPLVILRSSSELQNSIALNPFAGRTEIHPSKLLVVFLAQDPDPQAREIIARIKTDPEEVKIEGRELYIYFPNGMGTSKLQIPTIEKAIKTRGTARNWNTVTKLLELAEKRVSA